MDWKCGFTASNERNLPTQSKILNYASDVYAVYLKTLYVCNYKFPVAVKVIIFTSENKQKERGNIQI